MEQARVNNSPWRLIPLLEAPGKVQMAIDLWLLQQHRQGKQPSTIRFYTWSPAAISLGYHQRRYPSQWHHLFWQGKPLEIVRRPSGGRAVLHQGDLTYAIVTSEVTGKRQQVYQHLCQFLIQGWRAIGLELQYGKAGKNYTQQASCFGTATGADLVSPTGDKVIGSAQLWQGNTLLQHGSMLLATDAQLFQNVFAQPSPATLTNLLQESADILIPKIVTALIQAAQDCFGVELREQCLSAAEWAEILNPESIFHQ